MTKLTKNELKLKVAAEEIKDLLRKHDIAGIVSLHAPGHAEYIVHLNPSYSCAYIYNDNEVRFYAKRADFKNTEEHQQKKMYTANMLSLLTLSTGNNFMMLNKMSEVFDKLTGAEHTDPIHKIHGKQ